MIEAIPGESECSRASARREKVELVEGRKKRWIKAGAFRLGSRHFLLLLGFVI